MAFALDVAISAITRTSPNVYLCYDPSRSLDKLLLQASICLNMQALALCTKLHLTPLTWMARNKYNPWSRDLFISCHLASSCLGGALMVSDAALPWFAAMPLWRPSQAVVKLRSFVKLVRATTLDSNTRITKLEVARSSGEQKKGKKNPLVR